MSTASAAWLAVASLGQADQVLLAGISSFARRQGTTGETLDLNALSLVPSGSAEHIPYMVYLA